MQNIAHFFISRVLFKQIWARIWDCLSHSLKFVNRCGFYLRAKPETPAGPARLASLCCRSNSCSPISHVLTKCLKSGQYDALWITVRFPNTSTHTSNDNAAIVPSSGNRGFLFFSLYCYNAWIHSRSPSPPAWCSLPLLLHTLEILHNYYPAKSCSLYSPLAPHILIWTFRSPNIDKARETESTQLSITTFPVLSMPLIFALLKGSLLFLHLRKHLPSHTHTISFCPHCYTHSALWERRCCMQSTVQLKVLGGLEKSLDKQQLDLMHH